MPIRVSIIGASGYGGGELVRLLVGHPEVRLVHLTAESRKAEAYGEVFPNLRGFVSHVTEEANLDAIGADSDVVFFALPNGMPMTMAPKLGSKVKIVDLGADFRFKNLATYKQWYKADHACPDLLSESVYGQPNSTARRSRAPASRQPGLLSNRGPDRHRPVYTGQRRGPTASSSTPSPACRVPGEAPRWAYLLEVNENVKPYNGRAPHGPKWSRSHGAGRGAMTVTLRRI
jgi:N-acetyl-gamma-glutamyl-phosphate reductase